jgi:hypothetical protein
MVAIAETIIERRAGARTGELSRPLLGRAARASRGEDKRTGDNASCNRRAAQSQHLMEAWKRSLAQDAEPEPKKAIASKPKPVKAVPDRRHWAMLPPVSGGREKPDAAVGEPAASTAPKRRREAGEAPGNSVICR